METTLDTELLTLAEAAALLKVNSFTLRRWIDQGILPAYRVGQRRLRVRRIDLARMITPIRGSEEQLAPLVADDSLASRQLTKDEQARALAAVKRMEQLQAEWLVRRGGRPFTPTSGEILNEMRDERTRQLDDLC
jgi:excisionase family DNA binding protein